MTNKFDKWKVEGETTAIGHYTNYWISVYFNKDGDRTGCLCLIEEEVLDAKESEYAFVIIPENIRRATLLWSETEFRHNISLTDFLNSVAP